ncbi:MAG: translational GTPase TypA [Candidatus Schekmanbacteria bacterium]|nr:translational GTPase TypA [Candidatus Schekmanbacteria bacterium]
MQLRNIAIIAHVDHGKTTLVDAMLRQARALQRGEDGECILDRNDLERERGITILAKNTAVQWNDVKINIVDTPGHADFGGEVERALSMVDGVLVLVDAAEGPMPQTRFVLRKAIAAGLKPIVIINKVDRQDARPGIVLSATFDLMADLGASDEQLDFPHLFAVGRQGRAWFELGQEKDDLADLFDSILKHIPVPQTEAGPFQLRVANLDYSSYIGRIAIGQVRRGSCRKGDTLAIVGAAGTTQGRVVALYSFHGLSRYEVEAPIPGDIIAIAGLEGVEIGDSICHREQPDALPRLTVDEPTVHITMLANTSPFSGQDGKFVSVQHVRDRLRREKETNLALRVFEPSPDRFELHGRGELHLTILFETMRREGYELAVGQPQVLWREENGRRLEPYETLVVDVPEQRFGAVMEQLGARRAEMVDMSRMPGRVRAEFRVPARGLFGFRSQLLTLTLGEGIMAHNFSGYGPDAGPIKVRTTGSAVASETGVAFAYSLLRLQERVRFFIEPTTEVYCGMIVGENSRQNDMAVNVCKNKKLTNMRSSTADEYEKLTPAVRFSLEEALEFLADDELLEITPKNLRLRKKELDPSRRKWLDQQADD